MACGGKRILSIIDRLSASLLEVKEEAFVIVLLENETLSKGERVKGHQFYWCDYYLYIAGVAKEMIPNRANKTDLTEHFKMSPARATTPDPLASSHLSSWALLTRADCFSVSAGGFITANHLVGHWGWLTLGNNHYNTKDIAFLSIYCSPGNGFHLLSQLTIHKINVTLSALRTAKLA